MVACAGIVPLPASETCGNAGQNRGTAVALGSCVMASKRLNGYGVALLLAGLAAGTAPVAAEAGGCTGAASARQLWLPTVAPSTRPRPTRPRSAVMFRLAERAGDRSHRPRALSAGRSRGGARCAEPAGRTARALPQRRRPGAHRPARDHRLPRHALGRGLHRRSPGPPHPTARGPVLRLVARACASTPRRTAPRRSRRLPGSDRCSRRASDGVMSLLRAVFQQDLRVRIVSPSGHGEVWTPSVRPQPNRPRARLRFTAPAPGRLPGLLNAEALAERQSYAYPSMGEEYRETRYRLGGGLSDWVTSWLRWEAGVAFDQIASVSRGGRRRPPERAGARRPAGAHRDRRLLAGGRRRKFVRHPGVRRHRAIDGRRRRAGRHHAGRHRRRHPTCRRWRCGRRRVRRKVAAPRCARIPSAREGIITGEAFGRRLVFSTTEYQHPLHTRWGTVALALFVDAAQAWRRVRRNPPRLSTWTSALASA